MKKVVTFGQIIMRLSPPGFPGFSREGCFDRQMTNKFPSAKKAIKTLTGSISATLNTRAGASYDRKMLYGSPRYQIIDIGHRIRGGDSFMGGFIFGLLTYPCDDRKALDTAIAASFLKRTTGWDVNLV